MTANFRDELPQLKNKNQLYGRINPIVGLLEGCVDAVRPKLSTYPYEGLANLLFAPCIVIQDPK